MKPGNGETILTLNLQREIKALEAGLEAAGLTDTDFGREVFEAGHEADYNDPRFDGKQNTPPYKRAIEPEFKVTASNLDEVRAAIEANIAQAGLVTILTGRRKVARYILRNI